LPASTSSLQTEEIIIEKKTQQFSRTNKTLYKNLPLLEDLAYKCSVGIQIKKQVLHLLRNHRQPPSVLYQHPQVSSIEGLVQIGHPKTSAKWIKGDNWL
jgi:hypothetical protein